MDLKNAQGTYNFLIDTIARSAGSERDSTKVALNWCGIGCEHDKLDTLRQAIKILQLTRNAPTELKTGSTLEEDEHWALATLISSDVAAAMTKLAATV